jgi:hypothetical protein
MYTGPVAAQVVDQAEQAVLVPATEVAVINMVAMAPTTGQVLEAVDTTQVALTIMAAMAQPG